HVPCTRPDCVLPGCVNLKLQTMNNNTRKTKMHGNGPKSSCIAQNTEMGLTAAGQNAASLWDQDLIDILNILGDENNLIPFNLSENDLLMQNQPVMQFQRTLSLGTRMKSNDSVLLENAEQVGIGQAFSGQDTGTVHIDVIANTTQATNQSPSKRNTPYDMNGTVPKTGASPRGVKRSTDNRLREIESTEKKTIGDNTQARKKFRNPTQSTNNLFRILGLILQAFKSPLTSDLEEHYIRVLNRALFEIRNAHRFLQ
ncbi:unnamed protein product, partial [Porites evermanni]